MEASIREEERREARKHQELYQADKPVALGLKPMDWLRFDSDQPSLNSYVASVRALGDIAGKRVLDFGCGDGWLSVILAKRGAIVDGFDISSEAIKTAVARAKANALTDRCHFFVASGYSLPLGDNSYSHVVGQSILHHLSHKEVLARELARIVKPGGIAVFSEPFGNSLWLERLRLMVPVASQAPEDPDEWEHQFKYKDVLDFQGFTGTATEFQLLSRLDRVFPARRLVQWLNRLDGWLLSHVGFLRPYAREVMVKLIRQG